MSKILIFLFFISFVVSGLYGQTNRKMSEEQRSEFEQQFIAESKNIATLRCDFIQTKTSTLVAQSAINKGVMLYKKPSMLVWEYTQSPKSTLVVNGKNAVLFNEKGKAIGNDRLIRQLGEMIINMVNGNSISDSKMFKAEAFYSHGGIVVFELTPIQKRLKDYYQKITIKIDLQTLIATEIVMSEKSGDSIAISLHNIQTNKEIPDNKFNTSR